MLEVLSYVKERKTGFDTPHHWFWHTTLWIDHKNCALTVGVLNSIFGVPKLVHQRKPPTNKEKVEKVRKIVYSMHIKQSFNFLFCILECESTCLKSGNNVLSNTHACTGLSGFVSIWGELHDLWAFVFIISTRHLFSPRNSSF